MYSLFRTKILILNIEEVGMTTMSITPFLLLKPFLLVGLLLSTSLDLSQLHKNGGKIFFYYHVHSQIWPNSWICSWVSRNSWCEGHWCGSTYMVMRLSDISSKTGKKCIFCVFRLFLSLCRTASWPYRLSHTNALRINQFY